MLTKIKENDKGAIFQPDHVPADLFNFYILKRREYKDGTASWNICCELRENIDRYLVIENMRGTRDEAVARLEKILEK